jgi:alpha-L-fucosidase 2
MQFRSRALVALSLLVVLGAAACSRKPASIQVSPKKITIYGIDRAQRINARILDKKGQPLESGAPGYMSSDPTTAEVDAGGRVVAKKAGKATVTASFEGVSTQIPVEVVDVGAIEFPTPTLSLIGPAGTSIPLNWRVLDSKQAKIDLTPTWSSGDPKVVTVSDEGVVTSVGPGKTNVVARIGDVQGVSEIHVTVRDIARVELRPATALVRVGDSQHFVVTAYGADGVAINDAAASFSSSDPAVASVDTSGVAMGHKAGAATIRVRLAGATAEASLLVN